MSLQKVSHFYSELSNSSIENIEHPDLCIQDVQLDIKRDDCLHSIVSGNKWRKLKHVLLTIESSGYKKVASMGGMYSNLLHALSYLCYRLGWQLDLLVRGHPQQKLTPALMDAVKWGARLNYINRENFRKLRSSPPDLDKDVFWIPEGGFHELSLKGTAESIMELPGYYDYIVMATATGASLAGISCGIQKRKLNTRVIGISVLNNASQLRNDIAMMLHQCSAYDERTAFTQDAVSAGAPLIDVPLTDVPLTGSQMPIVVSGFEFGGYAKKNDTLIQFIAEFESDYDIPLEPVYSGKSFYATCELIKQGFFRKGSKILLIHCGGLQGKRSV